jgi:hypothetical protein
MEHIAWPAVALVLGMVFIFVFRQPVTRFLDRTRHISAPGIKAMTSVEDVIKQQSGKPVDDLLSAFDNPMLRIREKGIKEELDRRQISDPTERERALIRHLASLQNAFNFENAYRLIWGSQLAALDILNTRAEGELPEALRPIYHKAAENNPEVYSQYSFDEWLTFLKNANLLRQDEQTLHITIEGREFLKYLIEQGRPFVKNF